MRAAVATAAVLTIVLAAGCQQNPPDPVTSALEPGAEVIMVKTKANWGDDVPIKTRPGAGVMGSDVVAVKLGTTGRVVSDPGGADPQRLVQINVRTEDGKDVVGTVERGFVRPVPR